MAIGVKEVQMITIGIMIGVVVQWEVIGIMIQTGDGIMEWDLPLQ